jgi:hypothetical protein
LLCGVFRAFRRIAANRNDGNNASTSARIRQAAWTGAALVVPVALSVALLPLRAHVDDVLVAVVLGRDQDDGRSAIAVRGQTPGPASRNNKLSFTIRTRTPPCDQRPSVCGPAPWS